ncbi:MAG: ABC transporter ATP-binding protein [Rubrivivax sp.]
MSSEPATPPAPTLALHDVHLRFGSAVDALAGVTLSVAPGEFVALLGPSGCGKSTVLRLAAGLLAPSSGRVRRGGDASATAFVFQEPTLMPWASVFDNVWLPLRLQGRSRAESEATVRAQLATVGLAEFERAYPAQLSGGMKMRASIARALVTRPALLLMDEPFAALDDLTRQKLQQDLLAWWQRLHPAVLFVTHNVSEAVALSSRVLVMGPRPGRIAAEVVVDSPHPRPADFRHGAAFHDRCRAVERAMTQAMEPAPGAAR